MSGLAFAQAPSSSHPLRFLITSLLWGVIAGLWLCVQGGELLASRWNPATLVMVHMLALGVLGNAMIGSLYQFLPVAAGSPLPWPRSAVPIHVLLNLGLLVLLSCFLHPHPALAGCALLLLGIALLMIIGQGAVALVRGQGTGAVRIGIGLALACLLVTVMLGGRLLGILVAWSTGALDRLTDLHATFGLGGWALGLLASVGSITVPMLQGTRSLRGLWLMAWWWLVLCGLAATAYALLGPASTGWRYVMILPVLVLCVTLAVLQWRAPHPRNPALRRFWSAALLSLAMAALMSAWPMDPALRPLLIGVFTLALALPWFVVGMLLEIVSFLAWIALRRRHPRGVRVPGVGHLLDEPIKLRLWWMHVGAGVLLVAAIPLPSLARLAGIGLALAYAATLHTVGRCWREARHFQPETHASTPA